MQIMPKIAHQNLSIRILSRAFSLNETRYVCSLYTEGPVEAISFSFTDYSITTKSPDATITSQHRSEVEATIANNSILPHSDWHASSDRSKPISMPYLRIFATVSFNLTTAKMSKYSAMIGLLYG
jgi:hypothetical protein